ncbi:YPDG domain-containing protein [Corynebacterium sp. HMSC074H12]|uniref:YPDG domain-containing protein n=3 Tax=Corynebacterium TaxID=1716 RepID=UPI0008AD640B|nr:YPDG domain-containing protein [Corynebacterium sp. HMSC074H12]OFQ53112.1 hypothetical protein HMPREF2932_06790 [Corynebacterium sp. HMSC074H12]
MNKKEIKRTAVRRRGTTIAAAALSIAMVGPFVHAVTPASPFAAVANVQENQPAADAPAAGSHEAIYSPGKADQKGTISGSVKEIVEAKVGFGNVQASGKALKGVKVYAQWYEGENTQHSSPVYYTESDANGNFTIKMAPYTDAKGVQRKFEADASVGETVPQRDHKREKIRVWTELPEDMTDKYRLVHQPAAGIFPAIGDVATPTSQGDGPWGGNKVSEMTIQYAQKDKLPQHLPEEKWAESVGKASNNGTYAGRAFWNLHVLLGGLNHNTISAFNSKDLPAPGMKVVGSYLNDEAVTKIEEHVKSNFAGKTLRGRDWTTADEAGLQKWINEQVAADPEGWIAETVTTTTGADGRFALKWKGLYGNNHTGTGGGINPDADKLHKLAGSWEEGSWLNGNKNSKHVNMDWSYISIYDKDGNPLPDNIGTLYPWALGNWAGPSSGGANAQLFGGDSTFIEPTVDGYTGWNIALAPQALKFDVVDKNTTDNWAKIGDKVQTDTAGLPLSDNLSYYIEWYDKDGNVVKTCAPAKADSASKIPSCEFEVPKDAKTGDTFTARLKATAGEPDSKNDLVLAMDAFAVTTDYLEYDSVDAKVKEEATSEPKFDNPASDGVETKPEKAKFELGKLPEGVTEDQVSVDEKTGVVTFTPNAEQAGKSFNFPVVMRDEALQVPVLDENGDPVKDESGNPKTQGRVVARADATFKVAGDTTAATVEPSYEDTLVVPGKETKSEPVFVKEDEDGKPTEEKVDAPSGSTFKIADGFTAPEGYTVEIDESTGVVTVTADPEKLNKDTVEEFEVPVTVTYPDESTDDVKAKFELDTDGDGTPDTEDEDDDGDGVPDQEEIDKDTNPKDKNERPLTPIGPGEDTTAATVEPEYEDGAGEPGENVTVPAPEFKDKDKNPTEAPDGTTFKPGDDAPEGVTVDENTGEITVPVPEDATPGDKITVPVEVTYPDGSKDTVDVTVTVEEPDAPEQPDTKQADELEPKYNDGAGKPGTTAPVDAPKFTNKDGDTVTVPEGTKFITDEDGVEVAEDGSLRVQIPADATPGDKITVPVTVTYPDGSTDKVDVTVTVTDPEAKPEWGDGEGEPGGQVTVPNEGGNVPEDSTVEVEGPGKAELDENGNLVVDIDKDAKPGDKVVVEVKDPEGNTIDESTVTVTEPPAPAEKPDWTDDKGKPGDKVEIPNDGGKVPDGTTVETEGPGKAEIDDEGNLIVDIDKDAKPGDKVVVIVKDKDGKEIDRVVVEVEKPDAPAPGDKKPDWKDDFGKPGDKVEIPNDGGKVPDGTTVETEGPGKAEIDDEGNLIVDIDKDAKPGDKVVVIVKDKDGNEIDRVVVEVEKPKSPIIPGPTWPIDPNKPGKDDPSETPEVIKPTIDPAKDGDKEITGTAKPGTDITVTVTDKDGKKTEKTVKVGDDGKWKVVVDKELKTGDKIVAKDKDGNEASRIVTGDSKPGTPDGSADWTGSSNLSERCINTGLGIGIPLLFLIPVGLASQMNIPGLSEFVAPINKQIQDLNTRLQQQAGLFNGPLADQVNGINAQLKRFGADYQQAAGAVALIAAGALAIGMLADACAPGAGEGSSK